MQADVPFVDECEETGAVLSDIVAHLLHGGKCALGLRQIKDVGIAKADENARVLLGDVLLGLLVLLALDADDGGEDTDATLPLLDLPAKLVPCIHSGNAGCIRPLPCDLQDVPERVVMKAAHCVEIGGERIAMSPLAAQ
jgi:hypothetical protein